MARITVEDCLNQIPNRFKLTLAATYRARELAQGHAPRLDSKDKPTVTALREIAGGAPAVDAAGMLADVLGRCIARVRFLASVADERGTAGELCERSYEALNPSP